MLHIQNDFTDDTPNQIWETIYSYYLEVAGLCLYILMINENVVCSVCRVTFT